MATKLTDDELRKLTIEREQSGKAQLVVFDTEQAGLAVTVGANVTTFIVHHRVGKSVHRETLGRWKSRGGDMSVPDARRAARKIVGKLEGKEATPGSVKRASKLGPTLAEATALYLAEMERTDCRPTSIDTVRREIADPERSYLKAWLDRPLASITGKECRARHLELAGSSSGGHVANRVMRHLRAIWNYVAKEASAGEIAGLPEGHVFPANPTISVKWIEETSKSDYTERRAEPIDDEDLPAWRAKVMSLASAERKDGKQRSGARRDYHLIVILTGLRRSDASSLRWEHINLTNEPRPSRVWHAGPKTWEKITLPPRSVIRPSPKGGADRAFAVPLSTEAIDVLERRKRENTDDGGWVFPTVALTSDEERIKKGKRPCYICQDLGLPPHTKGAIIHITEPKEDDPILVSPHRLRDTYATVLGKLDPPVGETITKLLMNHSLDESDVTEGYMSIKIESLRSAQQRVADYLVAHWTPKKPALGLVKDVA